MTGWGKQEREGGSSESHDPQTEALSPPAMWKPGFAGCRGAVRVSCPSKSGFLFSLLTLDMTKNLLPLM